MSMYDSAAKITNDKVSVTVDYYMPSGRYHLAILIFGIRGEISPKFSAVINSRG